ncbi:hypothetical protein BDV95DRAFT_20265 [Massariosphaeria phaeospora]|uniref:Uncharacterized protein n=1 Tax=Massariosphaeria phaeospora TaxID=100035 RepID=A0A7C8MKF1_9PLEO|nr:hypothetical protein BDV95DRAFT_20265 [Massariosphaeria phaeospora]
MNSSLRKGSIDVHPATASPLSMTHGDNNPSGSGNSTPNQAAPPAPPMFSTTSGKSNISLQTVSSIYNMANAEAHYNRLGQRETDTAAPTTLATMRSLKARKLQAAKAELQSSGQRLKNFTGVSPLPRGSVTADRAGSHGSASNNVVAERTVVDDGAIKTLQNEVAQLRKDRAIEVEQSMQDSNKVNERTVLDNAALKGLQIELESLILRVAELEKDNSSISEWKEKQMARVETNETDCRQLKQWKESLRNQQTAQQIKVAMQEEVKLAMPVVSKQVKSALQLELKTVDASFRKDCQQLKATAVLSDTKAAELAKSVNALLSFKEEVERDHLLPKLKHLPKEMAGLRKDTDTVLKEMEATKTNLDNAKKYQTTKLGEVARSLGEISNYIGDKFPLTLDGNPVSLRQKVDGMSNDFAQITTIQQTLSDQIDRAQQSDIGQKALVAKVEKLSTKLQEISDQMTSKELEAASEIANERSKLEQKFAQHTKEHQATLVKMEEKTSAEMRHMSERLEKQQARLAKMEEMSTDMHEKQEATLAKMETETQRMSERLTGINASVEGLSSPDGRADRIDLEPRVGWAERNIEEILAALQGLDEAVLKTEHTVHNHSTFISTAKDEIPANIESIVGKHKADTDRRFEIIEGQLILHGGDIASLKEDMNGKIASELRNTVHPNSPRPAFTNVQQNQLTWLLNDHEDTKKTLVGIQQAQLENMQPVQTGFQNLSQQVLALTEAHDDVNNQVAITRRALQQLESRYENISTGDLYQKMCDWIGRTWPQSTMQQIQVVQNDLNKHKQGTQHLQMLAQNSQLLQDLLQDGPQLRALAQHFPELQALATNAQPTWRTINQAIESAKKALSLCNELKEHQDGQDVKANELRTTVTDILNSEATRNLDQALGECLSKYQAIQDAYNTLHSELTQESNERKLGDERLETSLKIEHDERTSSDENLESRLREELNDGESKTTAALSKVQGEHAVSDQQTEKRINEIESQTRLFSKLVETILQIQEFLGDLNQNLPNGKLKFEWSTDFRKLT